MGNTLPIENIPVGTTVHCIELRPGKGAQMARSAGAVTAISTRRRYATLLTFWRNAESISRLPCNYW